MSKKQSNEATTTPWGILKNSIDEFCRTVDKMPDLSDKDTSDLKAAKDNIKKLFDSNTKLSLNPRDIQKIKEQTAKIQKTIHSNWANKLNAAIDRYKINEKLTVQK